MEEALHFWRQEFAPKTPPDAFNKEYAYNVRHNYGKEGGRKDYTPYSCVKIITTNVGVVRPERASHFGPYTQCYDMTRYAVL